MSVAPTEALTVPAAMSPVTERFAPDRLKPRSEGPKLPSSEALTVKACAVRSMHAAPCAETPDAESLTVPLASTQTSPSANDAGQRRSVPGVSLEISTWFTATVTSGVAFHVTASSAARSKCTAPASSLMLPVSAGVRVRPEAGVKLGGFVVSLTVNEKSLAPLTFPVTSTVTELLPSPMTAEPDSVRPSAVERVTVESFAIVNTSGTTVRSLVRVPVMLADTDPFV